MAIDNKTTEISRDPASEQAEIGPRYQPVSFFERQLNPPKTPEWLVERLFPKNTLNILAGDGNVGKSFLSLNLAFSIASGRPFLNHFDVQKGNVLLIDEEGNEPMLFQRLEKLRNGMNLQDTWGLDYLVGEGIFFDDEYSLLRLKNTLIAKPYALVIVDSLVRVHRADENKANEMAEVLGEAKKLCRDHNTTMLFVHHTRKPSNGSKYVMRGSSDIRNLVDGVLMMKGSSSNKIKTISHDKSRWAEAIPDFQVLIEDIQGGDAIAIRHIGESLPVRSKEAIAEDMILDLFKIDNEMNRQEILKKLQTEGVGNTTTDRALSALVEKGKLNFKGGNGKSKLFTLVSGN